jgi:hypothetical protein
MYFSYFAGLIPVSIGRESFFYFVNNDVSIEELLRENELFAKSISLYRFDKAVLDFFSKITIERITVKAKYTLQNMVILEVDINNKTMPRVYSFNLTKKIAFIEMTEESSSLEDLFFKAKRFLNGKIKRKGLTVNGLNEGKWQYFDKQGRLQQEIWFHRGIINGKVIYYYTNGNKKTEGTILNQMRQGQYKEWYENGQFKMSGKYTYGIQDSIWNFWYENGQKKTEET